MATHTLHLPEDRIKISRYLLRHDIPALQLISIDNGLARWGPVVRLPQGSEISDFSKGFDDETLQVRFNGCFYIIFKQDIEAGPRSMRASG